ncbi:MAG: hypothetical protein CO133_02145, partial [Candidatus Komeilibacteria bacterium CG_4_9_14_3_um_filter_37_5]
MKLNKWLLSLLLLIITTLSLFAPWGWLKLSLAILNLLTLSIIYGYWQEGKKQILVNLLSGYLLLFSLIVIINALLLFYWEISYLSNLILYLIFVAGALIIIKQKEIVGEINFSWPVNFLHPTKKIVIYLLYWLIICSLIILFTQIFFHRSEQIIFSIWQILPSNFLLFYLLLIISLFVYLTVATTGKNIALMSILFLSSGLGVMIYRLNYGFDPFIHQATESIIWGQGFVTPRPIYYLGYYGIINFFQHFLSLSNVLIDRYITIINYAIILPLTINQWSTIKRYHYWPAAPLFLLLLPLTTIALNTPQALANVLLLITIFLLLADDLRNKNYLLLLLGLTTILIHPLSGIPLIFCLLFYFYHFYVSDKTKKNLLHILSFILLVLSPAILLVINSMLRGEQMRLEFVTSSAQQIFANIVPGFNNFVNNFDFVYLYENWWVILLISYFLIITIKYRSSKYYCYGLTFLGVSCGYLILKTMISFDFLISYEKDNYSNRLWEIGLLFLIPYLIIFWLKVL